MGRFTTLWNSIRQRAFLVLLLIVFCVSVWSAYHLWGYVPQKSWIVPVNYCSVVQFSKDNNSVLLGSYDWLAVWDVATRTKRWEKRFDSAHYHPVYVDPKLSPDGTLVCYRQMYIGDRHEEKSYVFDTTTGREVISYLSKNEPWWDYQTRFTLDGKTLIYSEEQNNNGFSKYVFWDIPQVKARTFLPSENYSLACVGHHPDQGNVIALWNAPRQRVEVWNIATGVCWKTIAGKAPSSQSYRENMWLSADGKLLYLAASHSREEQIKQSFYAAFAVTSGMTASYPSIHNLILALDQNDLRYDFHFFLSRSQTQDHWFTCIDLETEQVRYSRFVRYPARNASARFLLHRSDVTNQIEDRDYRLGLVDVFDIEQNQLVAQVPVKGSSHQVDLLSHNADLGEDFSLSVAPQSKTIIVDHNEDRRPTRWDQFREWLGEKIPSLKSTNHYIESDHDLRFYDISSAELLAELNQRRFNCFSEDGRVLATARSNQESTAIEVWDWPLRRPWVRIFAWPLLFVALILLVRRLFAVRTKRIPSRR